MIDEYVLSFHDINPSKKGSCIRSIPKGKYVDLDDFSMKSLIRGIYGLADYLYKVLTIFAKKLELSLPIQEDGYRALSNISDHGWSGGSSFTFSFIWW